MQHPNFLPEWGGHPVNAQKAFLALCGIILLELGHAPGHTLEDAYQSLHLLCRAPGAGGRRYRGLLLLEDEKVSVPSPTRSFHPGDELSSASALS